MNTISIATAAVTGARHLRAARNGQDAVAVVRCPAGAMVVVADGCGSAPSSEVGARLGAQLFARALERHIGAGAAIDQLATWEAVRVEVVGRIAAIAAGRYGSTQQTETQTHPAAADEILHDSFLFTLVAAAVTPAGAAVWALGDGAYSFGDRTRVLGPFEDNQPPYLTYDLMGGPREAHFEVAPQECDTIIVATDGACELEHGLERFAGQRFVNHPDTLRRELAILARGAERIDWDARRVVRTPARLQDDCAIGVLRWRAGGPS